MSSLPCSPLLSNRRDATAKAQTQHSARMWGSAGMSEVLHSWPSKKVYRSVSAAGEVKLRSPSADSYLDFGSAPCDLDLVSTSDAEPKGPQRMPSKVSTASCDSFMTASTTSTTMSSARQTNRSRRDSAASWASGRSARSHDPGPRADHLWRELSHGEPDEQQAARLVGHGQAIGGRGKSSAGIPWRHIPSYDRSGIMGDTGDRCSSAKELKHDVALTFRRCSSRFSNASSRAMLECLAPVVEHTGPKPGAGMDIENPWTGAHKHESRADPREAWLEVVKRRSDAKRESWTTQRRASARSAEEEREDPTPAAQHLTYKQQLKNPRAGTEAEIRDACPFHREDSEPGARAVVPATPQLRLPQSPGPSMFGAKVMEGPRKAIEIALAEKVTEARRDYAHAQKPQSSTEKQPDLNATACDASALANSNSQKTLCRSASARGMLSGQLLASEPPVHSIRARGAATKPRWK